MTNVIVFEIDKNNKHTVGLSVERSICILNDIVYTLDLPQM